MNRLLTALFLTLSIPSFASEVAEPYGEFQCQLLTIVATTINDGKPIIHKDSFSDNKYNINAHKVGDVASLTYGPIKHSNNKVEIRSEMRTEKALLFSAFYESKKEDPQLFFSDGKAVILTNRISNQLNVSSDRFVSTSNGDGISLKTSDGVNWYGLLTKMRQHYGETIALRCIVKKDGFFELNRLQTKEY